MLDRSIIDLRELTTKATCEIHVLLILPEISQLQHALEKPLFHRNVATFADLATWLQNLTLGTLGRVTLVLPVAVSETDLKKSPLWAMMCHCIDTEVFLPAIALPDESM